VNDDGVPEGISGSNPQRGAGNPLIDCAGLEAGVIWRRLGKTLG
jgi:hypothetical protein